MGNTHVSGVLSSHPGTCAGASRGNSAPCQVLAPTFGQVAQLGPPILCAHLLANTHKRLTCKHQFFFEHYGLAGTRAATTVPLSTLNGLIALPTLLRFSARTELWRDVADFEMRSEGLNHEGALELLGMECCVPSKSGEHRSWMGTCVCVEM